MNTERILRLAKTLSEAPKRKDAPVGFNMANWINPIAGRLGYVDRSGHSCGTTACIAGHAFIQMKMDAGMASKDAIHLAENTYGIWDEAAKYLGLHRPTATHLFEMMNTEARMDPVTPQQAAHVLRKLVKTGEVDWSAVERAQRKAGDL